MTLNSQARKYAREVLRYDPCSYCAMPAGGAIHADHIEPACDGGRGDWENLTAACPECNMLKSVVPLLSFLLLAGTASVPRLLTAAGSS